MSLDLARRILQALGHDLRCPFRGCTCPAGPAAMMLYAEASKVVREQKGVTATHSRRRQQFERAKPTVEQMERYLGPRAEWEQVPVSDLAARFRDRGWQVNDSDLMFDTFAKIREGTLEPMG